MDCEPGRVAKTNTREHTRESTCSRHSRTTSYFNLSCSVFSKDMVSAASPFHRPSSSSCGQDALAPRSVDDSTLSFPHLTRTPIAHLDLRSTPCTSPVHLSYIQQLLEHRPKRDARLAPHSAGRSSTLYGDIHRSSRVPSKAQQALKVTMSSSGLASGSGRCAFGLLLCSSGMLISRFIPSLQAARPTRTLPRRNMSELSLPLPTPHRPPHLLIHRQLPPPSNRLASLPPRRAKVEQSKSSSSVRTMKV